MKRLRWKRPWHYLILATEGFVFGFCLTRAVNSYPSWTWMLWSVLGFLGFVAWIMTDVLPAN